MAHVQVELHTRLQIDFYIRQQAERRTEENRPASLALTGATLTIFKTPELDEPNGSASSSSAGAATARSHVSKDKRFKTRLSEVAGCSDECQDKPPSATATAAAWRS